MYGNTYGNAWKAMVTHSMKAKEIHKGQTDNSE